MVALAFEEMRTSYASGGEKFAYDEMRTNERKGMSRNESRVSKAPLPQSHDSEEH